VTWVIVASASFTQSPEEVRELRMHRH
jgi:hypothetical protein